MNDVSNLADTINPASMPSTARSYDPRDWYWKADDGRIFASARQMLVTEDDADYVAFAEVVMPSVWPRDDAGEQTDDALQDVLRPYEIATSLPAYAADVRWRTMSGGITVNGLPVATDSLAMGNLNSASLYAQSDPTATFAWKLEDGSFVTLSAADVAALQAAVSEFGQSCYACEDTTLDGIEGGTITTTEEIDAAFAAIQKEFSGVDKQALKTRRHKRRK
jgi:hypothetical protein